MKRIVYREWRLAPQRYWALLASLAVIAGICLLPKQNKRVDDNCYPITALV